MSIVESSAVDLDLGLISQLQDEMLRKISCLWSGLILFPSKKMRKVGVDSLKVNVDPGLIS